MSKHIAAALRTAKRYADGGGDDTAPADLPSPEEAAGTMAWPVLKGMATGLMDWVKTPGNIAQQTATVPQPTTGQMWTEEDEFRRQQALQNLQSQQTGFGAGTALGMLGTGTQFAEPGALGAFGGKGMGPSGKPAKADVFTELHPSEVDQAAPIGDQAGTSPGGTYTGFSDGRDRYIKEAKSEDHAKNEKLAAELYKEAGIPVADVELTRLNGKPAISSPIISGKQLGKTNLHPDDYKYVGTLQSGLPADQWLANYDVLGLDHDNIIYDGSGTANRIDTGGALRYRAQGAPKSWWGPDVKEFDSMHDPDINPNAANAFFKPGEDQLTDIQRRDTAQRIANISDQKIYDLVKKYGPSGQSAQVKLANELISRRDQVAEYYGAEKPSAPEVPPTPAPKPEPEYIPLTDDDWDQYLGLDENVKSLMNPPGSKPVALSTPKIMQINKLHTAEQLVNALKDHDYMLAASDPSVVTKKQLDKVYSFINNKSPESIASHMSGLSDTEQTNVYSWMTQKQMDKVGNALSDLESKKAAYEDGPDKYEKELQEYYQIQAEQELKEAALASGAPVEWEKGGANNLEDYVYAMKPLNWSKYTVKGARKFSPLDIPNAELDQLIKRGYNPNVELWHGFSNHFEYPEELHDPLTYKPTERAFFTSHNPKIAASYGQGKPFIARAPKAASVDWTDIVPSYKEGYPSDFDRHQMHRLIEAAHQEGYDLLVVHNMYDIGSESAQTQYVFMNPSGLRAPKAKFDPAHLHKAWPLAGVAGGATFTYGMMPGESKAKGQMRRGGRIRS